MGKGGTSAPNGPYKALIARKTHLRRGTAKAAGLDRELHDVHTLYTKKKKKSVKCFPSSNVPECGVKGPYLTGTCKMKSGIENANNGASLCAQAGNITLIAKSLNFL